MGIYNATQRGTVFNSSAADADQEALLIPTQHNSVTRVEVRITSCTTDNYDEGDTYHIVGLFQNDAGTLTIVGSVTEIHAPIESVGGRSVTMVAVGTNVSIDVSPADASPITWVIDPTVTVVTSYVANSGWAD